MIATAGVAGLWGLVGAWYLLLSGRPWPALAALVLSVALVVVWARDRLPRG